MTWEIVEIEASHIIALSTLRLNVPQSLATATALDLASMGAETGAHHGAALLKLAQQLSLLQRKHRFLPVPLIDPIADVHLSAQPTSACEVTAAAASASASAAAAAAAAATFTSAAAAPAEKGRGGRTGRGLGVVVGGRGGRGGRGVSVTAKVAMGATDGAAGAEVGGSSRVGDDGAVAGESDGSGAVVGESDGGGAVVGESDGGGAGYPSPLAAMVARLSRSLQEHRSALQAHPYSSHAEIAILISAEAQRRALLGEIAEIDRVRLRDCEIARLRDCEIAEIDRVCAAKAVHLPCMHVLTTAPPLPHRCARPRRCTCCPGRRVGSLCLSSSATCYLPSPQPSPQTSPQPSPQTSPQTRLRAAGCRSRDAWHASSRRLPTHSS